MTMFMVSAQAYGGLSEAAWASATHRGDLDSAKQFADSILATDGTVAVKVTEVVTRKVVYAKAKDES